MQKNKKILFVQIIEMLPANDVCSSCSWFCTIKYFTKEVYINTKYTEHLQLLLSMTLTKLRILKLQKLIMGRNRRY